MTSSEKTLHPEIWDNICAHLTPPSHANLRLVSPTFNSIALPWKYRSIRLEAFGPSVERFINIAKTPELRDLVREVTIDTRVDLNWEYARNDNYPFPTAFMNALPYLRYFTSVTALHIRFEEHCGNQAEFYKLSIEETYLFRYKVLDTIFHCAAGLWTLEKQLKMDEELDEERYICEGDEKCDYSDQDLQFRGSCFALRELTIANLADYADTDILDSKAWQTIMDLPTLIDFKLFITTEEDEAAPENEVYLIEKYDFFDSLPSTWLSSNLTQNLRVLSLYFKDYWGWFPFMDLRDFGHESPFPQLKVLALGNYVFTHDWQVDWFPKIGKENGGGGLEELYLDDCPILFHASHEAIDEHGYPDYLPVTEMDRSASQEHDFHIRWHHVLAQWKDSMRGLKVFRMGHGSWWGRPERTYQLISADPDYAHANKSALDYRLSHNTHRTFACPIPSGEECQLERWRYGEGLDDERSNRMTYIAYDLGTGPSRWIGEDDGEFELEEGVKDKDDVAWDAMMAAIQARCKNGKCTT
ncbi:hypothetical protein FVEN_g3079 [Fusarium venenatum]|uniref:F-box domain-containing protein n=1 Tax=Fusarium venenatum TaxID=56646 RepID=A0A2L2TG99_9HYPO|nr:uncharacterized protein FVRRES_06482 [Fusarium venenatum]KAG8359534.1 hypothetical protein FVEN_g3079 [Fusarium venenatum]KAH6993473.1 hypothetical protein EDB82DRAFT_172780 [Fusarium venenatum]CEI62046.1 unnamed protein product [Fusarium venenatum]